MILEGIVTTQDSSGQLNVAPMGPIVDCTMRQLILRPYQSSTTFTNLKSHPCGVFHVVDDVLLIARAALDRLEEIPPSFPAIKVAGRVLNDCCRWYEFEIEQCDESQDRAVLTARVAHEGRIRDHFGFNRAKHAVLEATILATRLHLMPAEQVQQQLQFWAAPVAKTAGPQELQAFQLVEDYIREWYREKVKIH